jgi:Uncharacterized protein conserved in bacteria
MNKFITTMLMSSILVGSASAESDKVGTATLIKTAVNGDYGSIEVKEPVHRNERIRTSKSGLGEFLFADGTKLAVGWGSSVVIDKFVYDDDTSLKKLSIKAAKGSFRWISGKSKSTAYSILTPSGTIGVRGTMFDFFVGADGTTAVVLLKGSASFCGSGGCVQLKHKCDCVIAKRGQRPDVSRASRRTLAALGTTRALPFLTGNQDLSSRFGPNTGCGMAMAAVLDHRESTPSAPETPNRATPNAPAPDAPAPNRAAPSRAPGAPAQQSVDPDPPAPQVQATKRGHGYGDKRHVHDHKNDGDNLPDVKGVNQGHYGR